MNSRCPTKWSGGSPTNSDDSRRSQRAGQRGPAFWDPRIPSRHLPAASSPPFQVISEEATTSGFRTVQATQTPTASTTTNRATPQATGNSKEGRTFFQVRPQMFVFFCTASSRPCLGRRLRRRLGGRSGLRPVPAHSALSTEHPSTATDGVACVPIQSISEPRPLFTLEASGQWTLRRWPGQCSYGKKGR